MKKIMMLVAAVVIIALSSCAPKESQTSRYTFHKLSDNKVIIIDQKTGKFAKYEFSANTYSPDSLYVLKPEWNKKKK